MAIIKVLVVDDSAFMRKVISDIINQDKFLTVVGTARNGQDALHKIESLRPNVVTLDVEMPIMDGIATLEEIIRKNPIPVIMLSSITKKGADATVKALAKGAIDFIAKPAGHNISQLQIELNNKIKLAANVKISGLPKKNSQVEKLNIIKTKALPVLVRPAGGFNQIVLIGTSTGGPKALQEVLPLFPRDLPAPVLVVQHMPPGFTKSLADRLDSLSTIRVKEAEQGEILSPGVAYIAPGDFHLTLVKPDEQPLMINLTREPPVNGHRPSVNVMMESASRHFTGRIIGVIMTGMGNDGTEGMKLIKKKQGITIAEAESTCVVFGMPKAAVQANCVDMSVSLNKIAEEIIKLL